MEQRSSSSSSLDCKLQVDEGDFNLKEWGVRASRMSTNNPRRFSASNLMSLREEARSFRSNITISSTASSPGYTVRPREEIDPSTYSFTTALKALQAKSVYTWEFQSAADGMTLNSKWNEAEKYICNPLSGEVPLECLSAKTLSGRSFRGLTTRITMSAPLIYPSQMHHFHSNPPINEHEPQITSNEKKTTRDVGTQSTPVELSSSSPSPAPTPSIQERSIKNIMSGDSSVSSSTGNLKSDAEVEVKERRRKQQMINCQGGCLSLNLRGLWMRTLRHSHRHKHKPRTNNNTNIFLHHLNQ